MRLLKLFFKENGWNVKNYGQLSVAQKKMLLNSSMVNNAYLIELLSNVPGNPPQEGMCMRREVALSVYDSGGTDHAGGHAPNQILE